MISRHHQNGLIEMDSKLTTRAVVGMCESGRAKDARKALSDRLKASSSVSKREQRRLLANLLYVEIFDGRTEAALHVLYRRRLLGYRNPESKMDDVLQISSLLYNTGHFIEARAELIELLRGRRTREWSGLLQALSLYVDADEKCRELMGALLIEGSRAAMTRFGIPLSVNVDTVQMPKTIRAAHKMFCAESKEYSKLLAQVFTARTQHGRGRIVENLRKFSENAKTDFFRSQAEQLLIKLRDTRSAEGAK